MDAPDMATMQAMLAAHGMGGGAPMTAPGAAPPMPLDPNMAAQAYMQMFSYVQQSLAAQGGVPGGLPGAPPLPFPGLPPAGQPLPFAAQPQVEPMVRVSVEGMKFQYQLTEDDLHKVFSRYGSVRKIHVDEVGASASIIFGTYQDAQSAINDLNGKVLNGLEGTLSISWLNQPPALPPSPYPGMPYPNWGFPPMPTAQAWPSPPAPHAPAYGAAPAAGAPGPSLRPGIVAGGSAMQRGGADKSAGARGQRKFTCRFIIGIDNDKDFQVARRIIGAKGANMKRIVKTTDAKLRLRGVGSGYFEGNGQKESSEPLQLCISCTGEDGYRSAVKSVEELLHRVYDEYKVFCKDAGREAPDILMNFTENQLVYNSRAAVPGGPAICPDDDDDDGTGDAGGKGKSKGKAMKAKRDAISSPTGEIDRGEPGPNAPTEEEIEKYIDERNEARRANNFPEADRLRQLLHSRGVALMDEPGGRGRGAEVTTWRYWRD